MAEIEMVCMHQGIYGYKAGSQRVAVGFIDFKKFPSGVSIYDESVFRQFFRCFLFKVELPQIINIAEIRGDKICFCTRSYNEGGVFRLAGMQQGTLRCAPVPAGKKPRFPRPGCEPSIRRLL